MVWNVHSFLPVRTSKAITSAFGFALLTRVPTSIAGPTTIDVVRDHRRRAVAELAGQVGEPLVIELLEQIDDAVLAEAADSAAPVFASSDTSW